MSAQVINFLDAKQRLHPEPTVIDSVEYEEYSIITELTTGGSIFNSADLTSRYELYEVV